MCIIKKKIIPYIDLPSFNVFFHVLNESLEKLKYLVTFTIKQQMEKRKKKKQENF